MKQYIIVFIKEFHRYSSIKIIHLPESIKEIADSAFGECSCLKYVSAPTDIAIKHSKIGAIYSYLLMLEDDSYSCQLMQDH